MAMWGAAGDYATRVTQLSGPGVYSLNATTIDDDDLLETIADDSNRLVDDWFLIEVGEDISNADVGEVITDFA